MRVDRGGSAVFVVTGAVMLVAAGCQAVLSPPPPPTTTTSTTTTTTTDPTAGLSPPKVYPSCPATGPGATHVVLYGDSLVFQSMQEFASEICSSTVNVTTYGQPGAALCDFTNFIQSQTAAGPPAIAVIAFSGNNDTPCVEDASGTPLTGVALVSKYLADAEQVMSFFTAGQTEVLWVDPPGPVGTEEPRPIDAAYQAVVQDHQNDSMLVDGGKYLRDSTGTYQLFLPCNPDELTLASCQEGQIQVRLALDGLHFCPILTTGLTPCPVYDAGGVRYGHATAEPVTALLSH
jgi:hypothetical protein